MGFIMKKEYISKEELALDIIKEHGLPEELSFAGFDQYNRIMFDYNIDQKCTPIHVISEIIGKGNFVDRYFIQNIFRVKK